jgi:hypothetical protein
MSLTKEIEHSAYIKANLERHGGESESVNILNLN